MPYFLLKYDNHEDRATVRRFDDREEAYAELTNGTISKLPDEELVLFITDSEETLRRTHPRYFYSEVQMAQQAADRILSRYEIPIAHTD